jgi:hypothetical protein
MADAVGHRGRDRRHPGLIAGFARFLHDPRGSMRALLDSRPGEARLLAYAFLAVGIGLAGRVAMLVLAARGSGVDLAPQIAAQTASMLFFVPIVYYALAALGTALARAAGGRGGWRDGRAAFFWAALIAAPVGVLSGLAALALHGQHPAVTAAVAQIGPVFFAWALAQCYAEAFGFRRAWTVFAAIGGIVLMILVAARLLSI